MAPDNLPDIAQKAEAFLFAEGGALTLKKLAQLTYARNESELIAALKLLGDKLKGGGISLVVTDSEAALVISQEAAPEVQKAYNLELSREIGDAGLEVLTILLYRGPSSRADIDYIRGVNSSTTLRTLLARGLVLRAGNPKDAREYVYRPSAELLAHLGAVDSKNLPEYDKISSELASFEAKQESIKNENENGNPTPPKNDAARS